MATITEVVKACKDRYKLRVPSPKNKYANFLERQLNAHPEYTDITEDTPGMAFSFMVDKLLLFYYMSGERKMSLKDMIWIHLTARITKRADFFGHPGLEEQVNEVGKDKDVVKYNGKEITYDTIKKYIHPNTNS